MQTIQEMIKALGKVYKEEIDPAMLQVYLERLRGYQYSTVKAAIDLWIDTSQWFPKVNQLLDKIKEIESNNPNPIMVHCPEGGRLRELCLQADASNYWSRIWDWDGHIKRCGVCNDGTRSPRRSKPIKAYLKEG